MNKTLTVRTRNDGTEDFTYSAEVPAGLTNDQYRLIAQGLLFENDWANSQDFWWEVK